MAKRGKEQADSEKEQENSVAITTSNWHPDVRSLFGKALKLIPIGNTCSAHTAEWLAPHAPRAATAKRFGALCMVTVIDVARQVHVPMQEHSRVWSCQNSEPSKTLRARFFQNKRWAVYNFRKLAGCKTESSIKRELSTRYSVGEFAAGCQNRISVPL